MTDLRRTILWVVFTMSLVLLWDAWNKHNGNPTLFGGALPTTSAPAASAPPASPAAGVPAAIAGGAADAGPATAVPAAPAQTPQSDRVTLTTDVVRATFDTRGGTLVGLELLDYTDQADPNRHVMLMDQSGQRVYLAQTGLVGRTAAALPNHLTPMTVLPGERTLAPGAKSIAVSFEAVTAAGKLVKTYTFERARYLIDVKHEFTNTTAAPLAPQLYLQLARDGNKPEGESSFYFTFTGPAMYTDAAKFKKLKFEDIAKGDAEHAREADDGWIAMVQHYFVSAWLMAPGTPREFRTAKVADNLYSIAMVTPVGEVAPGATKVIDDSLYVGPQEEYRLADLAPGLELVKDYGWLTILSKPLFWLLTQLHKFLGNWGWAIVALVVLLKIAFYWLNAQAYKSMAKMKAINPKITAMRERLKDKPQQMQQEMMRIYREEKVNPLGGCLPILLQMPIFIALYWVLVESVELRQAPFALWIQDLSVKDPYFVLPLLMGASMFIMQKLSPTAVTDPMQQKMMQWMPVIFTAFFLMFPSGLVLYWLFSNLVSIGQQWLINRAIDKQGLKASV